MSGEIVFKIANTVFEKISCGICHLIYTKVVHTIIQLGKIYKIKLYLRGFLVISQCKYYSPMIPGTD